MMDFFVIPSLHSDASGWVRWLVPLSGDERAWFPFQICPRCVRRARRLLEQHKRNFASVPQKARFMGFAPLQGKDTANDILTKRPTQADGAARPWNSGRTGSKQTHGAASLGGPTLMPRAWDSWAPWPCATRACRKRDPHAGRVRRLGRRGGSDGGDSDGDSDSDDGR